jgi:hypothetical protein
MTISLMVVRNIADDLHDKLWTTLGGENLRLIVMSHIDNINKIDSTLGSIRWNISTKIKNDIDETN